MLSSKEDRENFGQKLTINKAFALAIKDYGLMSLWKDHFISKGK